MNMTSTIFDMFGGIRPMARTLGEPASNVAAWKRVGRIPAEKQRHVLKVGQSLGLAITPELIIFPLGKDDPVSGPAPKASTGKRRKITASRGRAA